ncbi:non-ribosomal peptide synthetase [Actinophytocola oryzae]|uniref:Amino acid adenylation domain-containing protein n=1 Tax=Actinophytocola oryzae TaxID=502181 RepID=A0A4V3FRE6_9PSEU|nr:non-ribosomal peptide synthetase [Actinophytocola oryzae]TDV43221.1 amino acid adenylation domain-containing protein [Actinophytocola oryzae]
MLEDDLYAAFERLSPEKRALLTQELTRKAAVGHTVPLVPRTDELPCSFAQERLWYLDQADPGSAAYVMPAAVELRGPLDVDVLRRALSGIVARHEALRTGFVERNGLPHQRIRPPEELALPVEDLRGTPRAVVADRFRDEATRPFDLTGDLLVRASLLRVADDEHVLFLTTHHIVSDGWSLGVLRHELAALYTAFANGEPDPLPPLPFQYADFAAWQRNRMDDPALLDQLAHWRARLADAPVLELFPDHARPARRTDAGSSVPMRFPAEVVARIDRLAERSRSTRFMVLLSAFVVVLWRWSGQDDLVVSTPVAGRNPTETEDLVGFFVNTLALRFDLSGDPAFEGLLAAVRQECLAGYANQAVPFDRVVQELRPDRTAGSVPLVRVMLALRNTPMSRDELADVTMTPLDLPSETTKFDLCLDLVPDRDGGVGGRAEFSTDLFTSDTVRRMVDAMYLVLDAALTDPVAPVSRLPIATAEEQAHMIAEYSGGGTAAAARTLGTLHGLFQRQVDARPDAQAVGGAGTLTYRELDERANQLAWYLRSQGVGPEQIVGVSLTRSPRMVVAVLGILKAGAAYVPLDPGYPRRRVANMAEDARVRLVVTESGAADESRFGGDATPVRLIRLDTEAARIAEHPVGRPPELVAEPNLAYVVYTSGSTGRPKGSVNEHGRVANSVLGMNGVYDLGPADRMLAISSLNYDMSVYEVFGALAAGATVVVPTDAEATDPELLLDLLHRERVTAWSSAPAWLDMLVEYSHSRGGLGDVALRVVGVGGDRMPPSLPERLSELVPGVRLFNLAGMTEVSYCTTFHLIEDVTAARSGVPWGKALPNHRIYVLDRHNQPVPVGVPGELFIGGAGPGRGYWRRPGLTATTFVPDPYSPEPGQRMYATKDHARFLANGDLQFLGRLDHQIKIRGFRIEPGEVEGALAEHPDVAEPVVLAYEDGAGRKLAAYLTTRDGADPAVADLRRFLAERLPDHMVPSAFVLLDRFPLLPSGKLNRAALPKPVATGAGTDFVAPADALETVLAGIWADLLDVERVGVLDDFFDLGGHSLVATQAVARTRDLFRVPLGIPDFLAAGTVRELAAHLRETAGTDLEATAGLVLQVSAMTDAEAEGALRE